MKIRKIIYIAIGSLSLGLGAVGAVIPILPSVPFLMLAAFCFAKSSDRLHQWFIGTKLYKHNLESFVNGKGMLRRTKIRIILAVTLTMAFAFIMMGNVPIGRIILSIVWLCHILYFSFGVKTIPAKPSAESETIKSET